MEDTPDLSEVRMRSKPAGPWDKPEAETGKAHTHPAIVGVDAGNVKSGLGPTVDTLPTNQSKRYIMTKAAHEAAHHISGPADASCTQNS